MGTKTIWDGKDLPPIGCEVLAQLGNLTDRNNKGGWVRHRVDGYKVTPWEGHKHHFRVDVILGPTNDRRSSKNERYLDDLHPLDWREESDPLRP